MEPLCFQSDPQKTPQKIGERKHRIERDEACCAAETAEQKEQRLSMPRTKHRAMGAACAAAEVVSHIPYPDNSPRVILASSA